MDMLHIAELDDFYCVGGECSYTCCQGWNISIDEDVAEKYREFGYSENLYNKDDKVFIELKEKGICPFLNNQGLCDICLKHGEEYLSYTCGTFHRLVHSRKNKIEFGISNGCPRVIEIIQGITEKVHLCIDETDIDARAFSTHYGEQFYRCRDMMFDLMQLSEIPIWVRLYLIYNFASDINNEDMQKVIDKYSNGYNIVSLYDYLINISYNRQMSAKSLYNLSKVITNILQGRDIYSNYYVPVFDWYNEGGIENFGILLEEFDLYMKSQDAFFENLFANSIFCTHKLGEERDSIAKKALCLVWEYAVIRFCLLGWWATHNKMIDDRDEVNIICPIIRIIEHSSSNIYTSVIEALGLESEPTMEQVFIWIR